MLNKTLILCLLIAVPLAASDDYELYKQARTYWLENNWEPAAKAYKTLIEKYPNSSRRCKSENYLAYCYRNMGKTREAFNLFSQTIASGQCNEETLADARSERVNLAALLIKSDPKMKQVLVQALNDGNKDIRFLAAIKLVGLGDNAGMKIFFQIVEKETDQDLRELAVTNIMKFGSKPDKDRLQVMLDKHREANKGKKAKMIRLIIRDLTTNKTETRLNVPIGLFQNILALLSDEQIDQIKKEAKLDFSAMTTVKLEQYPPGTVLFKVVDGSKKEIKVFLE